MLQKKQGVYLANRASKKTPKGIAGKHYVQESVLNLIFINFINQKNFQKFKRETKSPVSGLRTCCLDCSQNCWIDWNSAVRCFKRLFQIGVWMFARFVRPLVATILCVGEIWSGSNNCVYMCITYFTGWQQKRLPNKTKMHHRTDFEDDLWPETRDFCFWPK